MPPTEDIASDSKADGVGAADTETFVFEAAQEGGVDEPNGDRPEDNANTELPPVEGQTLLDGWEELIDEAFRLPFYFDDTKTVTTWERPVVVAVSHLDGGDFDATVNLEEPV